MPWWRPDMKILHCIPSLGGGGAERQLGYLAPALVRMGHEVHIVHTAPCKEGCAPEGVVLHRLQCLSNYDPLLLIRLIRLVLQLKPDIMHTWILQMDILGGLVARVTGIPWILREPSSAMAYPATLKSRLRLFLARGAGAVVSNSAGGNDYWATYLPTSTRRIIRNGLSLEETASCEMNLYEIDNGVPLVVYVGRLTSDASGSKNLVPLLEALALVSRQRAIQGVVCGEGPQRPELERLSRSLGLEGRVLFTGQLPAFSVTAVLKIGTVFVSLSAYEGCPNTVMEAMQCGCPLVVSDIPAHREILDESVALFVEPGDAGGAATAIMAVLEDVVAAKERALRAKDWTKAWSIDAMSTAYEQLYRELI